MTATKTAKKTAAPKAPRQPKPEPVTLDLAELAARFGGRLTAWQKPVEFDHEHIAATAYCLILDTPEGARATHLQSYNGRLSAKQARHLDALEGGTPVKDLGQYQAGLMKRGFTLATPEKKTRGRKKAE